MIFDLRARGRGIAAAAQRLQNHLHVRVADGACGDYRLVVLRVQDEGCVDAGDIQKSSAEMAMWSR